MSVTHTGGPAFSQDKVLAASNLLGRVKSEAESPQAADMVQQYNDVAMAYIDLAAMPAPMDAPGKSGQGDSMPIPARVKRIIEGASLVPVLSQVSECGGVRVFAE